MDGLPGAGHPVRAPVDLEGADDRELWVARDVAEAPEHRPDAGDELAPAERLHDGVIGAQLEAENAIGLLVAHRHDDDRGVGVAAQAAAHLDAVDVGQPKVEQPEMRDRRPERPIPVVTRSTSKPGIAAGRRSPRRSVD
jgi:hypothetical protein